MYIFENVVYVLLFDDYCVLLKIDLFDSMEIMFVLGVMVMLFVLMVVDV